MLDLNEDKWSIACVVNPVGSAERHIDGISSPHIDIVAVKGDDTFATGHKPVLGTTCVPLVAQALSGMDLDRLDLEVLGLGKNRKSAPRALGVLGHPAILLRAPGGDNPPPLEDISGLTAIVRGRSVYPHGESAVGSIPIDGSALSPRSAIRTLIARSYHGACYGRGANPGGIVMTKGALARIAQWASPHVGESSDGILTSAGICEGFAGAGVGTKVLIFAGFAGLVAGTLAAGAVEYSKTGAERDQQAAELASERAQLAAAPDAELDELTQEYVSRGLSPSLARQVAIELTTHDALAAHAEAELGLTSASLTSPLRDALAMSVAFAAGAVLPWLAIVLIPGPSRAPVTFLIVLAALALTGWISARISDVHPMIPIVRTASIGGLSMLITYFAGKLFHP